MKTILYLLGFVIFFACTAAGQVVPEPVKLTWHTIVALIVGIYEVVIRIIPTVNNYSFIGKIIDILSYNFCICWH